MVFSATELGDGSWAVAVTTTASPECPDGEAMTILMARRRNPPGQDESRFRRGLVDEVAKAARSTGAAVYLGAGLPVPFDLGVDLVDDPPQGIRSLVQLADHRS